MSQEGGCVATPSSTSSRLLEHVNKPVASLLVLDNELPQPSNPTGTSYPYDGVHLWGGDLLGPLYGCQDLLLVLQLEGEGVWGETRGIESERQ